MSRNAGESNHDPEQELVSRRLELAAPSFEHQENAVGDEGG
jgi:hypothetical protein